MFGKVKIEWSKIIKEAVIFGTNPKRFLPYFLTDVVAIVIGLYYLFLNSDLFMQYSLFLETNTTLQPEFASALTPLLLLFVVWYLIKVFIDASVMKQVMNPKPKDFKKKIYPSFLITVTIVGLATTLINSFANAISDILTIIITLFLMFSVTAVAVDKKGFMDAINKSIDVFRRRHLYVFFSWICISIVSLLIMMIAAIPALLLLWEAILQFITMNTLEVDMLFYIFQNPLVLIICGLVFMVGLAIVSAVKANLLVNLYKKLR